MPMRDAETLTCASNMAQASPKDLASNRIVVDGRLDLLAASSGGSGRGIDAKGTCDAGVQVCVVSPQKREERTAGGEGGGGAGGQEVEALRREIAREGLMRREMEGTISRLNQEKAYLNGQIKMEHRAKTAACADLAKAEEQLRAHVAMSEDRLQQAQMAVIEAVERQGLDEMRLIEDGREESRLRLEMASSQALAERRLMTCMHVVSRGERTRAAMCALGVWKVITGVSRKRRQKLLRVRTASKKSRIRSPSFHFLCLLSFLVADSHVGVSFYFLWLTVIVGVRASAGIQACCREGGGSTL